jgi:hypothetical protein
VTTVRQVAAQTLLAYLFDACEIFEDHADIFDRLPLPAAFNKQAHVLSTRLSDDGEVGGLFGFRFD